jgi:hypothetical protein
MFWSALPRTLLKRNDRGGQGVRGLSQAHVRRQEHWFPGPDRQAGGSPPLQLVARLGPLPNAQVSTMAGSFISAGVGCINPRRSRVGMSPGKCVDTWRVILGVSGAPIPSAGDDPIG